MGERGGGSCNLLLRSGLKRAHVSRGAEARIREMPQIEQGCGKGDEEYVIALKYELFFWRGISSTCLLILA